MSRIVAKHSLVGLFASFIFSYHAFCYVYRYEVPWTGHNDFARYHDMVLAPWNFSATFAPFVFRQLTTLIASLVYQSGIYLNHPSWFQVHNMVGDRAFDHRVYFSLLFVNYISMLVIGSILYCREAIRDGVPISPFGLLSIFFIFFNWGGLFFAMAPMTEGLTWLMVLVFCLGYQRKSLWVVAPVLLLSIFQREMIPFIGLAFAVVDGGSGAFRRAGGLHFPAKVVGLSVLAIIGYFAVRSMVPGVHGHTEQVTPEIWVRALFRIGHTLTRPDVLQHLLTGCDVIGPWLLGSVAMMIWRPGSVDRVAFTQRLAALAVLFVAAVAASIDLTIIRVLAILTPILVLDCVAMLRSACAPATVGQPLAGSAAPNDGPACTGP